MYYREEDEEKKNEKICRQTDKQTKNKEHFKHWGHSNPLWILGRAGQFEINEKIDKLLDDWMFFWLSHLIDFNLFLFPSVDYHLQLIFIRLLALKEM